MLSAAYASKGMFEEALAAADKWVELNPDAPDRHASRALFLAQWGKREEAMALVQEAEATGEDAALIAAVYAQLGDADRAIACLERALDEAPHGMVYVKASPWSDPVRDDPRFQALLARMGFEE